MSYRQEQIDSIVSKIDEMNLYNHWEMAKTILVKIANRIDKENITLYENMLEANNFTNIVLVTEMLYSKFKEQNG